MWSDIFLFLFTAQETNWILTDRFVKLRWQAAHVYSMESTTCDVSPNFLLRSLVARRRPRSSGLYEAEDKTTTLKSCSLSKFMILNVEDFAITETDKQLTAGSRQNEDCQHQNEGRLHQNEDRLCQNEDCLRQNEDCSRHNENCLVTIRTVPCSWY